MFQLPLETSAMLPGVAIPSCPVLRIRVREADLTAPSPLLGRGGKPRLWPQHCPVTACSCFLMAVVTLSSSLASATPSPSLKKIVKIVQ